MKPERPAPYNDDATLGELCVAQGVGTGPGRSQEAARIAAFPLGGADE